MHAYKVNLRAFIMGIFTTESSKNTQLWIYLQDFSVAIWFTCVIISLVLQNVIE